jgi:hypothetical protein
MVKGISLKTEIGRPRGKKRASVDVWSIMICRYTGSVLGVGEEEIPVCTP